MGTVGNWFQTLWDGQNAQGIIAISALMAWLLPKVLYFALKLLFNVLVFLANVFGRDKVELWLKQKINHVLSQMVEGAQVNDIPRWLNKDQLALRELHWAWAGLVVEVPAVLVTINLPTFGYEALKLKVRYLFAPSEFALELKKLVHTYVREVRIQEPVITYKRPPVAAEVAQLPQEAGKQVRHADTILALYQEAACYHFHLIVEHGHLAVTACDSQFVLQDVSIDVYNRASERDCDRNGYLLSFLLTGLLEGANVSVINAEDSLTDYTLVINHVFLTQQMWHAACELCPGLTELELAKGSMIGKLNYLRLEVSVKDKITLKSLEGEYRINKPHIRSWLHVAHPVSFEGHLAWGEHGLELLDNYLVFASGLRLEVPCLWQEGRLVLKFPDGANLQEHWRSLVGFAKEKAEVVEEKYQNMVEQAKEKVAVAGETIKDKLSNAWRILQGKRELQ